MDDIKEDLSRMTTFLILSLIMYGFTIHVWRNQRYPLVIKNHIIILFLGLIAFNVILGLLKVFDVIESTQSDKIVETLGQLNPIVLLGCCLSNVLFFSVFVILLLRKQNA